MAAHLVHWEQEVLIGRPVPEAEEILQQIASVSAAAETAVGQQPPPGVAAARAAGAALRCASMHLGREAYLAVVLLRNQEVSILCVDRLPVGRANWRCQAASHGWHDSRDCVPHIRCQTTFSLPPQAASATPPSSTAPAENGAGKRKGKAGGGFVLGRGSALFHALVERAAAGADPGADDDSTIAARCDA